MYSVLCGLPRWCNHKEATCQCRGQNRLGFDPGLEDPLGEEMATHSSNFAWKFSWTAEPGGLQSTELRRVDTTE